MRYTRRMISFVLITFLVGLGSLVLSTSQVRAQNDFSCHITIEKVALANNNEFDFSTILMPGDVTGEFTLRDPDNPTVVLGLDVGQTLTITEEVPPGWTLDNIVCVAVNPFGCGDEPCLQITELPNGNGVEAFCEDDGDGSCTITTFYSPNPFRMGSHINGCYLGNSRIYYGFD